MTQKRIRFMVITFCVIEVLLISWLTYDIHKTVTGIEVEFVESKTNNVKKVKPVQVESLGTFTFTAYCPCVKCCGKTDGITSSGAIAQPNHTIAADQSIFPYGTTIMMDGKEYVVEDTGRAIQNNLIDVFFENHEEAIQFGRQEYEIIKQGDVYMVMQ